MEYKTHVLIFARAIMVDAKTSIYLGQLKYLILNRSL
jgi:hypothetical protein